MAPNICNIPASCRPVDTLARELSSADGRFQLADMLILLPNRRACGELRDAFVRLNGMNPTILPRIMPLTDPDEDELFFAETAAGAAMLPPAISPIERTLLFIRLIAARPRDFGNGESSLAQAAYLAAELGQLLDTVENEELSFDTLSALVPEEYAAHWQKTLDFLTIITEHFPQILAERGYIDTAQRRIKLLKMQNTAWQNRHSNGKIIIAGIPGGTPVVRQLIRTVSELDNGKVYLNGLDRWLDDGAWQQIDETHPQFETKRLLDDLGLERHQIPDLVSPDNPEREKLVSEIMRPAIATDRWRELNSRPFAPEAINGIHLISCRELHEEALAIAAVMRHTLEVPEKTAALVTTDRNLARRVANELKRWDITVDDSAGRPLSQTPVGIFLRLTAEACNGESDNVSLLGLLKHPLTACGQKVAVTRNLARAYEKNVLRGHCSNPDLEKFILRQKETLRPLLEFCCQPQADFRALITAHLRAAEQLAADDQLPGAERLWQGDDGEAAATLFSDLLENIGTLPSVPGSQYGKFIEALMAARTVRPKYGTHPRLKILGPIEARLTGFDIVIIGSVNEGTMPTAAPAGAWLSRPMKKSFGFPLPEKNIGIQARDFAHLLTQKEIYISRAERVEGTPTVKSRWWMRMETVLNAGGIEIGQLYNFIYPQTAAFLDQPRLYKPIAAPAPKPPLSARPRELWAGAIENLMRDPYIVFAKYILKLEPLDDINRQPGIIDFGIIVHAVLERFNRHYPGPLPADAKEILRQFAAEEFCNCGISVQTLAFWQPAVDKMIAWILQHENGYRQTIAKICSEISGRYSFIAPGGMFTIGAKADRIDITADGKLNIIDYKTGRARTKKEITAGYAPQLPIEALIAQNGGFPGLAPSSVASLRYWRLGREEICVDEKIDQILEHNLANIKTLVAIFDNPDKPYITQPNPKYAPAYSDYEHLSRLKEWGVTDRNEEQ